MTLLPDRQMIYTICQGCPASGKSTWAKNQPNPKVIANRDDARRELFDFGQWREYKFTRTKEEKVTKYVEDNIRKAAAKGLNVIDDNTNLNVKYLSKTEDFAKALGFEVQYKQFFDVPLHKLIERNLNREFSVPENVIHDMFRKQLEIQGRIIEHTEGLPECVIVDVDGTIADMGKGEKWGRMPYDWDKVGNDRPKENVVSHVRLAITAYQMLLVDQKKDDGFLLTNGMKFPKVIFLTGRDGVALDATKDWIISGPCFGDVFENGLCEIFIRTADDMRPDCDIKEELLREKILPRYNVKYILDDRKQVVDHWRCLGLECWQVAPGFF